MMCVFRRCHPGARSAIGSIAILVGVLCFTACGDDDSSFAPRSDDDSSIESSSSSAIPASSGDLRSSSSTDKKSSSSSAKSSSSDTSKSSSSETSVSSSSSAKSSSSDTSKLSSSVNSSSSSATSSSSVTLATPCKTETEDNCEYGELVDERDGQTYKTVKIGDQWWMAENLNFETNSSFCYKDSAVYCEKYGRLYTWAAAMDSTGTWSTNGKGCGYKKTCSLTYPVQGVCPESWHLPTQTEWNTLFAAVGGKTTAVNMLKSIAGWFANLYSNGNGTDAFSFSALPAGYRSDGGGYNVERNNAYFWGSTEYDSNNAYSMCLGYNSDFAVLDYTHKYYGFSVRCLKD